MHLRSRASTVVCLGRTGRGACVAGLAAAGCSNGAVQLVFRAADLAAAADVAGATAFSLQVRRGPKCPGHNARLHTCKKRGRIVSGSAVAQQPYSLCGR